MLKPGIYIAERNDSYLDHYRITMEVKETEKSYIFQLIDLQSRNGAHHIKRLFQDAKRVVLRKKKGGHAIRVWGDEDFTFYPFQAGKPYYFKKYK